ncbi:subtilisin-like serine protease [Ceratobasidium sp. 423]|nr:subtilisin-like serine protease [Ceratobasidium sp. 423]
MKSFAFIAAVLAAPAVIPITKLAGPGPILEYIRRSPDVEYIEADAFYQIDYKQGDESLAFREVHAQEEVSHLAGLAANGGVDTYGLDTGILTTHLFRRSRDGNGHGTHTAGTAVGSGFGLATAANIIAVKVCSGGGWCAASDVIAGINFAVTRAASTGRPSVVTMSLGLEPTTSLDNAVTGAIGRGIRFTVVAGNGDEDASNVSPARVSAANTIGAVDSSNRRASSSNYGPVFDVWALGVNVCSAWIGSNSAVDTLSGTSMATPHVAGILTVVIGNHGNSSPAALSSDLKSNAQAVVTGAPSGTTNLKARVW